MNTQVYQIKKKIIIEFKKVTLHSKHIELFWFPSHIRITENENVDQLAKEETNYDHDPKICLPVSEFRHIFKKAERTNTDNKFKKKKVKI